MVYKILKVKITPISAKCRKFCVIKCFKERHAMCKSLKRGYHETKALGKGTNNKYKHKTQSNERRQSPKEIKNVL